MPAMTAEERDAFLREAGILMRVATVRADGSPLVTPLWFLYEDGSIYFTPRAQSEWLRCLRADSRVALCIDEQPLPYRKIVVEGVAELVFDLGQDAEWRDVYRRIARRYVGEAGAEAYIQNTIDQQRALFRLDVGHARLRSWRMPVEGEAPEGIWHHRYYAPGTKYDRSVP